MPQLDLRIRDASQRKRRRQGNGETESGGVFDAVIPALGLVATSIVHRYNPAVPNRKPVRLTDHSIERVSPSIVAPHEPTIIGAIHRRATVDLDAVRIVCDRLQIPFYLCI